MEATESPGFFKRLFLNPLVVRELRVACRSWKLVIILSIYLLLQGAIFAIWLYVQSEDGIYQDPTSIGSGLFSTMSVVLVIIVMLVFPAFSSTTIASEHERKSFDLLLLTPMSPWEIAIGKFFAAATQASIFLIATVPLFAMANLFGGIEPEVFFVTLWMLVLLSVLISFVGVFASSLAKKSISAVLVTYLFALILGFILLVTFTILQIAAANAFAATAFPLVSFLMDPTLHEGIYYVLSLTATCAIYCTFLFISTTNRLKPTSHNKSTALRIFWTGVVLVVPVQIAAYFLIVRLPSHNAAYGALILGGIYLALLLLVPALSAPAEPPIPSRRVRREIRKKPAALMNLGGRLFYPGGLRGVAHTALVTAVGLSLVAAAAWVGMSRLESRLDGDREQLVRDYMQVADMETQGPFGGAPPAALTSAGSVTEESMMDAVTYFYHSEFLGYLALLGVLGVTLLVTGQVVWRLALSGISRTLAGVLAGLLIAIWLVVPYIGEFVSGSESEESSQVVAQFSPIHASLSAVTWGKQSGRGGIVDGHQADALNERASNYQVRWMTYLGASVLAGTVLLGTNLLSHRKVMRRVRHLTEEGADPIPQPVTTSKQDVTRAIEAVTQPAHDGTSPPPGR